MLAPYLAKQITPSKMGFVMPPEWGPHKLTWTAWPFDEALWGDKLPAVRAEVEAFIRTIAAHETVNLVLSGAEAEDSYHNLESPIANVNREFIELNDLWLRDTAPTFLVWPMTTQVSSAKWTFNGWGNKFAHENDQVGGARIAARGPCRYFQAPLVLEGGAIDVNGKGVLITTTQCLLEGNRNPTFTKSDYERIFADYLGVTTTIWCERGLEGDHTDGHVDTIVRFTDEHTIVCSVCDDPADPNFETTHRNLEILNDFSAAHNNIYRIVPLPLPKNRYESSEGRLPATYANFYIGNHFVVVPVYGDPHDEAAVAILRTLFPHRKVIPLSSKALLYGGGSFHCMTQQQPRGDLWTNIEADEP